MPLSARCQGEAPIVQATAERQRQDNYWELSLPAVAEGDEDGDREATGSFLAIVSCTNCFSSS
ncbi:hypothetical protein PSAB_02895 [Paenibacillus sabinae T27]|uniref:Uncharacterized protein n=1 Tax=Paenibacillus sabinae T27 TaxID=1268072 RepID=X4ZFH7_9BACL|nr:hypothetical protein PSAB_02895 [Paenibacillus sabinae T27]